MRTILSLIASATLLISCNNSSEKNTDAAQDTTQKQIVVEKAPEPMCYSYISNRDTVTLSITVNDNAVNGTLQYNFFEKDKNTGTLSGEFRGDTLYGGYTFASEGTTSMREVAFIKQGDDLKEGYGEMDSKEFHTHFKDPKMIDFTKGILLKKTVCN